MTTVAVLSTSRARKARDTWDHRREPAAITALQSWSAHNAVDVSFGLAIAREHGADYRPELLLWLFAQADEYSEHIARQLALRVLLAGARAALRVDAAAVAVAVGDAMHRARKRWCVPAEDRARELGMRKADFLVLRNTAEASLLHGIRTGLTRYLRACGYTDPAREPTPPTAAYAVAEDHRQAA